ncbi:MAG: thioredoxin [Gammaproteobacteria bacterium]|nr:thioredoxin [Rhodospirillaceae bacterium]MDE0061988.1 thioredoxin [Gammaproteobacteria bacterium]MDE0361108.1 thioredoxin [Rhodospirillaceae bacterium]
MMQVSENIVHTTDSSFEEDVINSERPVLIDFWAEWCGPCKMIAPTLDAIADEYKDRLKVVKVNVDENPQTPMKYNVRSIPTLILMKGSSVEGQQIGAVGRGRLAAFIDQHVGAQS